MIKRPPPPLFPSYDCDKKESLCVDSVDFCSCPDCEGGHGREFMAIPVKVADNPIDTEYALDGASLWGAPSTVIPGIGVKKTVREQRALFDALMKP